MVYEGNKMIPKTWFYGGQIRFTSSNGFDKIARPLLLLSFLLLLSLARHKNLFFSYLRTQLYIKINNKLYINNK